MSQKAIKNPKHKESLVNEETDIFLSFINKKIRNNRKKLDQIAELETRDTLKPEQVEKVKNKQNIIDSNKFFENCKDLYNQALQSRKDEEKEQQKLGDKTKKDTKEEVIPATETLQQQEQPKQIQTPPQIAQTNAQQQTEDVAQSLKELSRKISLNILNLVHFAQFFRDQKRKEEFIEEFNKNRNSYEVDNLPDFDLFFEFYKKIFTFSESSAFEKVGDKINNSLDELQLYLNGSNDPALVNKSYSYLLDTVQKITASSFFQEKLADVKTQVQGTNISAIGSELKPQKQVEHPVVVVHQQYQEPKVQEPVPIREKSQTKEPKPEPIEEVKEIQVKEENIQEVPVEETKNNTKEWADLEDQENEQQEEEEEEEVVVVGQHQPEQKENQEQESPQPQQVQKQEEEQPKQKGKYTVDSEGFITIERKKKQDDNKDQGQKRYGKKPYGGKPYQGQGRPRGDRPQDDRPQEDRPRGNRPQGDRPQGDRPQGDRPQGDRPKGDRPKGDRYQGGDRPQGDRPYTGGYRGNRGGYNNRGGYERKFEPKDQQQQQQQPTSGTAGQQ